MPAPNNILQKIQQFEDNLPSYKAGNYNETQARHDFIDPLFEALGWDVNNTEGYAEAYREVVHEDAIKVEGKSKAPDYCFRIGGTRKFFVEAKKPAVNIKEGIDPAFQLRRYAWSAKLPLSILTDFEEFAVYDCRIPPDKGDGSGVARVFYCTYTDFPAKWDEIAGIFSKTAILKGAFDRYAEDTKNKRGTTEVDAAFLGEIEKWRTVLAGNLARHNPHLTARELNFAVQITIDRIIFLRICEDRGIEEYGRLQSLLKGKNLYARLCEQFRDADERYNSGLFHFQKEKGRREDTHDTLTPTLKVDDAELKAILTSLYYPAPYAFDVFPADILGQVYERFLGKVIRLDAQHRAFVEEKPEVKKAGGVYYTPTYIVNYIVERTVGKALEGKTSKTAAVLKILDPACGSGSFLLGAYTRLLDWHLQFYLDDGVEKHAKGKEPKLYRSVTDEWKLTTTERRRILLNNLYGVDIDPQAVEVTKLSLLLKMLEGETKESVHSQLSLSLGRVLPDLDSNIRCGNSLIGSDFYDGKQLTIFDEEEMYRVNVFDWHKAFPQILTGDNPGFDCVIGNPPYGAYLHTDDSAYLRSHYKHSTKELDTYALFMEKSVELAKPEGRISMIVPTGWYSGPKFTQLRRFICCTTNPDVFVNLPYDIFNAWVDTTVFVTTKRPSTASWPLQEACTVLLRIFPKRHRIVQISEFDEELLSAEMTEWFVDGSDEYLTYADHATTRIMNKIKNTSRPLEEFCDIQRGVTPYALSDTPLHATSRRAFDGVVRRYKIEHSKECYIRFDETLAEPKPERYFQGTRLLLRELISRQFQLQAVKVTENFVTNKSMQSLLMKPGSIHINYTLGIVNSRLMSWYFLRRSNIAQRDDFPKIVLKETRSLPILPVNIENNEADRARHDALVGMVERMLDLTAQLSTASPATRAVLQKQAEVTDTQIDRLVYELYGLTPEEIALVEGAK